MDSLTQETQKKMSFNITARFNREPVFLISLIITAIPQLDDGMDNRRENLRHRKIAWSMKYTDGPTSVELQMLV
jgi:hypothetical protein